MAGHELVVAGENLDVYTVALERKKCLPGALERRVREGDETDEEQVAFVGRTICDLRGNPACRDREHAKSTRAQRLVGCAGLRAQIIGELERLSFGRRVR